MKRILLLFMLFGIVLTTVGCVIISDSESNKGEDGMTNNVEANKPVADAEQDQDTKAEIASGIIYELTDNNFIEAWEYHFTEKEIQIWNRVLASSPSVLPTDVSKEMKYIICLYDMDGNELYSFALDEKEKLYCEDGIIDNEELSSLINQVLNK